VGAVMGAGIATDVTDLTFHHERVQTLQVHILRESRCRASGRLFRRGMCVCW
jgi:hypothetical protein